MDDALMADTFAAESGENSLFDVERMANHARRLARSQSIRAERRVGFTRPPQLLLRESYRGLNAAYSRLVRVAREEQTLTPAADWLLDNFYVIRDAARQLSEDLPWSYYRVLPKLEGGALSGRPRIYEIVSSLADRADNALDQQNLWAFVSAYQEVTLLQMSELWALPAMLRLVLLQKLSALGAQVSLALEEQADAERWAHRITERATEDPSDVVFVLAEMAEQHAPLRGSFILTLTAALRAEGPSAAPALDWLEQRLEARSTTVEAVLRQETQRQTHRQASIANAITALRRAGEIDWSALVESLSSVDRVLRRDPAGVYTEMDFPTRDRYRHVVEDLARHSRGTELGVAERAVQFAEAARPESPETLSADNTQHEESASPANHVGYWLVGAGRRQLENEVGYRPPLRTWAIRRGRRRPGMTYVGAILTLLVFLMLGAWAIAAGAGARGGMLALALAASFFPAFDLAVSFTNWMITRLFPPERLPKMAFERGVPAQHRTFVVVPTLITSPRDAQAQAERLEVHALANPDAAFRYALLSDFADAPERVMPEDDATLAAARQAIQALNRRWRARQASAQAGWHHAGGDGAVAAHPPAEDRFFLLHRERRWNEKEGVWMGWERKRGKLEEFNKLLRPSTDTPLVEKTTYTIFEGDIEAAMRDNEGRAAVEFVITLDADTQLPPGTARDLVRTATHPLNQPVFSPQKGRVVQGYGILQPRVGIVGESERRTPFARIFSGNVGVDPYTTAVSDLYQDLFGVGIFTGKGLYHVDAFRDAIDGAIPEDTVLSHDLLEGNYARAALVTDTVVFDAYPSSYTAFAKRLHRWVRGDWQILPWLFGRVRDLRGQRQPNPVPNLGRWKTFDNLRRSLTPPSILLFLLLGWTVLPGSPFLWTLLGVGILAFPIYARFTSAMLAHPKDALWSSYLKSALADVKQSTVQVALSVTFLAHQAMLMLDAIARTLWRMVVSRKRMLEWTTAYQVEIAGGDAPGVWLSPLWGFCVLGLVAIMEPVAALVAVPFAAAWIAAPFVARRVSQPEKEVGYELGNMDRTRLRRIARRTWRFFDAFVSADDHWLPPDNFQEHPARGLARRTSPTNMGMGLLAIQSGYDLGYATRMGTVERLVHCLDSLGRLERHAGHFYNWYSTETAETLLPRYISTVDSGNLVASLVSLRQAMLETSSARWPNPAFFDGLRDTLACLQEELTPTRATSSEEDRSAHTERLRKTAAHVEATIPSDPPATTSAFWHALVALEGPALALAEAGEEADDHSQDEELRYWAGRPLAQVRAACAELEQLAPWATAPPDRLDQSALATLDRAHSLAVLLRHTRETTGLTDAERALTALLDQAATLAETAERLALEHDFRLLYDHRRDLFLIGYNADSGQADTGTYDLLASECRVASLVAIGKGDVEAGHWFRLGRPTTNADGYRTLLSWSGTLFEYLMPLLFTRQYRGSLLEETCLGAVGIQRAHARRKSLPWGVSESAYYLLDLHLTYQYRAFGTPGLGLKRGLADDYVVAPYATLLALPIRPDRALANLDRLRAVDAYGPYGFYESIDFTKERLPADEDYKVVQTYMAHHQGMGLLAIVNALTSDATTGTGLVQQRFHREPLVRSVELLLQERVPRELDLIVPHPDELEDIEPVDATLPKPAVTHVSASHLAAPTPAGMLLSNGRHTTFVTAAGAGYAQLHDVALTRWAPDRTRENDGVFLYIRDVESNRFWSAGRQPTPVEPDRYDAWFHLNKVETARVDNWIETFTEIAVSPEDDVELRRFTLTNYSDRPRTLELTSYAEVVLTQQANDAAHPAFSKLFVRTEVDASRNTLLAYRRSREEGKAYPVFFHALSGSSRTGHGEEDEVTFETDRMRFIGRNRDLSHPTALDPGARLSGTVGPVLDPIVSLRRRLHLGPKERAQVTFVLGGAPNRDEALRLSDRYARPEAVQRAFDLAVVYGLIELPHCGLSSERALYFQQMAAALLYGSPQLRAPERTLFRNRRPQSGLWAYGISGDLPIVLVRVAQADEVEVVRVLLQAHAYWRLKKLEVDLVVLNEHPPSYADEVQRAIMQAVETSAARGLIDRRGGVFVRRTDGMPDEDVTLLLTVAHAVLDGALPDLSLDTPTSEKYAPHVPTQVYLTDEPDSAGDETLALQKADSTHGVPAPGSDLLFFNGYGGFSPEGDEYVIRLGGSHPPATPLPWTNVIAHDGFGFLATEAGTGMTWQGNSQMNKLTPWSNDPVSDPAGEALYVRDEESGLFWSPLPQPAPGSSAYEIRHGFGYSHYRHTSHDIETETTVFAPMQDPVKVVRLRLTNTGERKRTLSVFRYQEWVLGERRERTRRFVTVRTDLGTGALFAQNRYSPAFAEPIAFADAFVLGAEDPTAGVSHTADRTGFLGRGGRPAAPAALLAGGPLDGKIGARLDPCAAFRVPLILQPGESAEVVCLLGQVATRDDARALVRRYRDQETLNHALQEAQAFWRDVLGHIQIETPSPALDLLVNGWLLYQNLGCRLWGRSAFYQSGGAFGFRDQIQDACALIHTRPDLTRAQLLLHAAHQFEEGDVLHWWHPQLGPAGAGVRTRFSDDLLWLPYATAFYVQSTGDYAVLDEEEPFLVARLLEQGEDEVFLTPEVSDETGTLFEHGCRALDRSLTEGPYAGLPLMGSGDWNDGMNRVGHEGHGESVWLGFFLYSILADWIPICEMRGENERAARYAAYQTSLRVKLNEGGWDGEWFRRAYYDDGTPLGSAQNAECQIDAIAQGWSVISGAGAPDKVDQALESARDRLIDEEAGLIRLLTPPFDQTPHDPGYIKGYIPGVRENGGQYTHGVLWLIRAFAERGYGTRATRLLEMILPVYHSANREAADRFKTEPYAIAADVYGTEPHVGRGGWTWYTGSAGWLYRVAVESILGLTLEKGQTLRLAPRIPSDWAGFVLHYRHGEAHYTIEVDNTAASEGYVASATSNGETLAVEGGAVRIPLDQTAGARRIQLTLGPPPITETPLVDSARPDTA